MAERDKSREWPPPKLRQQMRRDAPRYRSWVGPPWKYDLNAAMQFSVMTALGLREQHYLLDVGCGSLRAGRLFIPYLLPGRYFGIEPEKWLIDEGIDKELGRDAIRIKQPTFSHNDDFRLSVFGRHFDRIVAQSIFTHADAGQVRACLAEAKQVLCEDGVMAATYIPDDSNYEGEGWAKRAAYRPEFMISVAAEAGLDAADLDWPHPNWQQRWLVFCHNGAAEWVRSATRGASDAVSPSE